MKFAVIGNPISHSLSPLMHHANFQSLNLENTYEAINVSGLVIILMELVMLMV